MTDFKSVHEALAAFQADVPVLTKDKSAHQSKYADLVQATKTIMPILNGLGMTWLTRPTLLDDNRFVLEYELRHVPTETSIAGRWPLKLSENPQQMGSQVTYARRYAMLAVLGVAAEDEDDDGQAASGKNYAQRAPRQQAAAGGRTAQRRTQPALPGEQADPNGPVGQDQHRHMHALWRELGFGGDEHRDTRLTVTAKLAGLASLDSSADLTRAQAAAVIDGLKARKAAMDGAE